MSPVEAERSSPEAQSPESRTVSPAPQPGSAARPSLPRIVEALTKMSAAFAVFGYLSLRSHLNTLGISTRGSFGVERYLAELPEIIGIILFSLLGFGIPFAILCVVAAACSWLWRRVPAGSPVSIRLTRITEFIFACIESNEGPILASAGILLLGWLTMQTLMSGGSTSIGLAVGDLTNSHRPQEWALFFAILYGCGVAYLLCHGCRRHVERSQGRHASLWYLPMVLIACVAVQIPILYGHILHSSEYADSSSCTTVPTFCCGRFRARWAAYAPYQFRRSSKR